MTKIIKKNQCLEGDSISGSSRRQLKNRGMQEYNEKRCYQFVADFNVRAKVNKELTKKPIDDTSIVDCNREMICDTAYIFSVKSKYSTDVKEGISATHGASVWSFPQQSLIKIISPHSEIQRAIEKRELLSSQP